MFKQLQLCIQGSSTKGAIEFLWVLKFNVDAKSNRFKQLGSTDHMTCTQIRPRNIILYMLASTLFTPHLEDLFYEKQKFYWVNNQKGLSSSGPAEQVY